MRWIERACAVPAWLGAPAFILWISVQSHRTSCEYYSPCTPRNVPSDFHNDPAMTIAIVVGLLLAGLLVSCLIYTHSRTTSGALLAVMWISVPVFVTLIVGFAFTWMGIAAFFWGVSLLLAALAGSIVQAARGTDGRSPHQSLVN